MTSSEPPQWMSLACEKCGCERDVQLPLEDGTFMTAARYMALQGRRHGAALRRRVHPSDRLDLASDFVAVLAYVEGSAGSR
jgi:hypothetical protein